MKIAAVFWEEERRDVRVGGGLRRGRGFQAVSGRPAGELVAELGNVAALESRVVRVEESTCSCFGVSKAGDRPVVARLVEGVRVAVDGHLADFPVIAAAVPTIRLEAQWATSVDISHLWMEAALNTKARLRGPLTGS